MLGDDCVWIVENTYRVHGSCLMTTRVYEDQPLAEGAEIRLGERNFQHLVRALRLAAGDAFVVFDGRGNECDAQLASVGKREAGARLSALRRPQRESALRSHLGQVMSKGDRLDYAVQKAVELGVSEISLLSSTRCDIRLDGERLEKKREHLQLVAIAACEQSGRVQVPRVHAPQPLAAWLAAVQAEHRYLLHPDAGGEPLPATCTDVALLVGPEGGFTAEEVVAAQRAGFSALVLGPRVLRTETAPVAALALLQSRYGDWRN